MKIFQRNFFATFVLAALAFSQATANEEPARFNVEGGLKKEIVDREPSTTEASIQVQIPETSIQRGIATNENGLPIPQDTQLQTESNGEWLPDAKQNQGNLVISNQKTPGTIRGGGLTTNENLTPLDENQLEPSARSMDSFRGTQKSESSSLPFLPDPTDEEHQTNIFVSTSNTNTRPGGLSSGHDDLQLVVVVNEQEQTNGNLQLIDEQAQTIQVEAPDQDTVSRTPNLAMEQPNLGSKPSVNGQTKTP